jgi:hypothetical protein
MPGGPAIHVPKARRIEHQFTSVDELAPAIDRRKAVFRRKLGDL